MLALFKESAMSVKEKEPGALVPFHMFYNALEQFLDHSHKGVISRALDNDYLNPNHEEECFDVNLLKTLFMIKYVKEIKPNVENLTSLMVSNIDEDRMELKQRVEDALKRLVGQTLVQRNNSTEYEFLTDEEQEINRAIKEEYIDPNEITNKVSEMIFDGLFSDKKYRYPAFNGRYSFAYNRIVDDLPYKGVQNHELTLKILTPNSDELADESVLAMSTTLSRIVLVVLPDNQSFIDEIRFSRQIEKFVLSNSSNKAAKYERIITDKKTELHRRSDNARLLLEEALKSAAIYVNGSKVQSSYKDIGSRLNDAIGRLVSSSYSKLSYIDTAMGESDIKKIFTEKPKQLTVDGAAATPNSLALAEVARCISDNTARHAKTSMKTLTDRFMKIPYGFVEADIQWLVAKLFKEGEIAFCVSSKPVNLISNTVDDIMRYVTRKEFSERLLTDKRVKATDRQKKDVRLVMKELFGSLSVGEDDDAIMSSFFKNAADLKTDLEKLEIRCQAQPKYPGMAVIRSGKKLLNEVLQFKSTDDFFASVAKDRDTFLDFADDLEPVRKFFNGDQLAIFDNAIKLMNIYDESRNFFADENIEAIAAKIKEIMKKSSPYGEIFRLPGLLDKYTEAYSSLLDDMEKPVTAAVEDAKARVFEALKGKLCHDSLQSKFADRFETLTDKIGSCNNIAALQNIKVEADAMKIRCLNEIDTLEAKLLAEKAAKEQPYDDGTQSEGGSSIPVPTPTPVPKTKKRVTVSIHSVNSETTWQLETPEDVRRYVTELEKKLLARLEKDTILNIEF